MAPRRLFGAGHPDPQSADGRGLHRWTHPRECDQSGIASIQERFYPLPNTGDPTVLRANNYLDTVPRLAGKPYYATSRLDHNFGANDLVYARFTMHQSTNPVWEGNLPAFGERRQFRQNKALTLSYTRVMGTSLVSELRYGYAYNNNPVQGPLERSRGRSTIWDCKAWRQTSRTSAECSRRASPASA